MPKKIIRTVVIVESDLADMSVFKTNAVVLLFINYVKKKIKQHF